jgi:hypothetical protein
MRSASFRSHRVCLFAGLAGFLLFLLPACQRPVAVSTSTPGTTTEKVLVFPFQNMARRFPDAAAVRSPISGRVFPVGEIADGTESLLLQQVIGFLRHRESYAILSPGRARAALSKMSLTNEDLVPDREMIIRIGARTGADLALAGYVYRFRERVGTSYGVNTPASVAFELHLIEIPTGRVRWSAAVDETQRSLSENLLGVQKFIARKGRWVTAEDLARGALEEAFETFP